MGIKKKLTPLIFIFIVAITASSFINHSKIEPINLDGVYYSPNKKSKIQFFKKKENYYGQLIWNVNDSLIDKNNPKL